MTCLRRKYHGRTENRSGRYRRNRRTHIERINNTLQGGKVVACADANIDLCKSVAEKYGIKAYEKGEDMIAADDIDAVVVTTLDPFHEQYVMAAIKSRQVRFLREAAGSRGGCL